jgi:hypothetical protein
LRLVIKKRKRAAFGGLPAIAKATPEDGPEAIYSAIFRHFRTPAAMARPKAPSAQTAIDPGSGVSADDVTRETELSEMPSAAPALTPDKTTADESV